MGNDFMKGEGGNDFIFFIGFIIFVIIIIINAS